ncbi:MAG: 3-keto-5-aminohexanoate cleavage protein [Rhodospirillales bacterium]|jgi:uncharacterized protein (DUF849 family)|nr:3-keto-5-aminohexanoate cleavage protein [Rhodospirillales bacterium]
MSSTGHKTIVTCAVTGSGALGPRSGAVPITPIRIAEDCIAAARAGAAVVHVHVRDPATGAPSMDLGLYRETVGRIRDSGVDVVLNLTTGVGARYIPSEEDPLKPAEGSSLSSPELRVQHVLDLKPEICSLDVATMNFGKHAIINTPDHITKMAELVRSVGTRPELEVFDLGQIELASRLIGDGVIDAPAFFQICLGVPGGAPATSETMLLMRRFLPDGAHWGGFGISAASFPMVGQCALLGGHVRVGLEDNLYLARGKLAPDNASLVERAVTIVESLGGTIATAAEARTMLDLRAAA